MSNRIAAGTIGTVTGPARYPMSRSAKYRTTPDAESSPERTPAAQDYGVDLRDLAGGTKQVGLSGARSGAANVHAPDGPAPAQHDRAPGTASQVVA